MKLITQTHLAYYNGQDTDPQKAFKYYTKPIDIHICQYTNIRDLHTVTIDLDRFSSKTLDLTQLFQVANKNPICETVSYELKSTQITNLNADIPLEAPITSCGNCFAIRNTSNLIIEGPQVSHTNKFSAYATIEIQANTKYSKGIDIKKIRINFLHYIIESTIGLDPNPKDGDVSSYKYSHYLLEDKTKRNVISEYIDAHP